MRKIILYIHGKGGSAEEAAHYKALFSGCDIVGFDYAAQTPWEAREEFPQLFEAACQRRQPVEIIANSIGAYFAMHALSDKRIGRAFFISPVVDMEKLILDMMAWGNVTEEELCRRGKVRTDFGETLTWEYLCYVRRRPVSWNVPTHILYGEKDHLTAYRTVSDFASGIGAALTVMPGGEHWFHTKEQMEFLDQWLLRQIG